MEDKRSPHLKVSSIISLTLSPLFLGTSSSLAPSPLPSSTSSDSLLGWQDSSAVREARVLSGGEIL